MTLPDDSAGPQFYRALRLSKGETDTVHLWIRKSSCNTRLEVTAIHAWFMPNPDRVSSKVLRYPCACGTGPVGTKLKGVGKGVGYRGDPTEARDLKGAERREQGRPPAGFRIPPGT